MEAMERHEGHLLNWYDSANLAPLHPRYVSTVDSGNLAGALLILAAGLPRVAREGQDEAALCEAQGDAAALLLRSLAALAKAEPARRPAFEALEREVRAIQAALGAESEAPTEKLAALRRRAPALRQALSALPAAGASSTPQAQEAAYWGMRLAEGMAEADLPNGLPARDLERSGTALAERLLDLARRAAAFADGMNFSFLFDRQRKIFSIGYRLADAEGPGRLDPAFYDLLASEARLTSFLAIAKGDVPQSHWFHLGRLITNVEGRPTLLSWSATMFEYLMPRLYMKTYPGTLLDRVLPDGRPPADLLRRRSGACRGGSRSPPSTSWTATATTSTRRSACRAWASSAGWPTSWWSRPTPPRWPPSWIPPPPSATSGAWPRRAWTEPTASTRPSTTRRARPTSSRRAASPGARDRAGVVVRAFLAHHQGMSLVALANVLLDERMVARFHQDPRVTATELLLQERVPRLIPITEPRPAEETRAAPPVAAISARRFRSPHTLYPHAQFLSNGAYTVAVSNAGGGYSTWSGKAVTRAREDRTRDVGSQFVYLRDVRTGLVWSAAYQPTRREPDEYLVTFLADKAVFRRRDEDVETQLEVAVSPEDDVEVRQAVPHQPRQPAPGDRGDELRGDRARPRRRRPGPSRLREALPRDRVPAGERGAPLPAASAGEPTRSRCSPSTC